MPLHMPEQPDRDDAQLDGFPFTPQEHLQAARDPLELVLSQFIERQRAGENPSIESYARRYPQLAGSIRELFPMVAAMEHWKGRKEAGILQQRLSYGFRIQRIGRHYRVIRELARGGMGVVFEAEHEQTGVRAAVKLLPGRFAHVSRFRRRFEQEAQTASALDHPNIVRVLEFGEWDGLCYYVMPFVEGVGLDWIIERLRSEFGIVYADEVAALRARQTGDPFKRAAVKDRRPRSLRRDSWKQFAGIGLQVADALRYAHAQATIHRDIKPGNLLLDKNGRVWVTDFGLARLIDHDKHEEADDLAGTLRYMAPERFFGQCDERCDIYGLGMSLYELVTLEPAVGHTDRGEVVRAVTTTDPLLPCTINPRIPPDLEAIIVKAIARKPEDRYQSAGQMMGDLLRFINDQPVDAPRPGHWRRFRNAYQHRRVART